MIPSYVCMNTYVYTDMSSSNLGSALQCSPETDVCLHRDYIKALRLKQVCQFRSKCLRAITLLRLQK